MGTLVMNDFFNNSLLEGNKKNENVTRSRRDTGFDHDSGQDEIKTLADNTIKFCSLFAEQLLLHPCIVLRRQCQVHHTGAWYHLTPISLIHTVVNIMRTQGGTVLWKGIGSVYIVHGINIMTETVASTVTTFPREVSRQIPLKKLGGHILLKGFVFAITTPLLAACLVETVQSDIASEKSCALDILFEAAMRISSWSVPKTARQIPLWQLIMPTVIFRMSHYFVSSIAQCTVISSTLLEQQEVREQHGEGGRELSVYEAYFPQLLASFTGGILADVITFPLETVLHRLYVQGTRTIIDNTDTGIGVIPVNTHYEGVIDCFQSIVQEEGLQGFYRGFGALILQYALHAFILRLVKFMFENIFQEFSSQQFPYRDHANSPPSTSQPKAIDLDYRQGFSRH